MDKIQTIEEFLNSNGYNKKNTPKFATLVKVVREISLMHVKEALKTAKEDYEVCYRTLYTQNQIDMKPEEILYCYGLLDIK